MKRAATFLALVILTTCDPLPYTISGTWQGTNATQGTLVLVLADDGTMILGDGRLTRGGYPDIYFRIDGTLAHSQFQANLSTVNGDGAGTVTAIYGVEEFAAARFVAHFEWNCCSPGQSNLKFDGELRDVTRK